MQGHEHHPIETIKLSERDKAKLLRAVEAQGVLQPGSRAGERRNLRVAYHGQNVLVTMNPAGPAVRYSVVPRNLSRGGMAFVHGRFVYPDTPCQVCLPAATGRDCPLEGRVVRCRHIGGIVHEVSVCFDKPIDLESMVALSPDEAERYRQEHEHHAHEQSAGGRVLLVDAFAADRGLLGLYLKRSGMTVTDAADRAAAERLLSTGDYDLALIDLHLPGDAGLALIERLRAGGFAAPIIALSAEGSDDLEASAMQAGANAFLVKPFEESRLADTAAHLLTREFVADGETPIHSALADDLAMRPLIREFVAGLAESMDRLRGAGAGDAAVVREVCRQLKGAGASYGFEAITRTAGLVLESIDSDTRQLEQVRESVNSLIQLLGRVRFA